MCAKVKVLFVLFLWLCLFVGVIQPQEEPDLTAGKTPPSSPSSGQKLNSYETTLNVWENINERFQTELKKLQSDLSAALQEAAASKKYSEKSTALLETSLKRTDDLENYNTQLSERLQERDEELAAADQRIDELEKIVLKKDNTILKMAIVIGALALVIIAAIIIYILKLYGKISMPWLRF